MKRVSRDASLHEKTVQKVGEGGLEMPKRGRRNNRPLRASQWGVKVDPLALAAARKLAHGDMTKVKINKDGSVTVRA